MAEQKSPHALREESIQKFWQDNGIFEKSLEKNAKSGKDFVFYEGPPTANGRPGIHHLEARAFKDAIPRYRTMCGFYVRRKGGWDTHGLPVELQVEKELGLKSKKEIETYGIAAFNQKCRESVWQFVREWEDFTKRMGYWIDLKNPYITYKPEYIESVWKILKTVEDKKLLYKDYKVLPWCPRCGTALSSHELALGYETVKDLAVTAKFKILNNKSKSGALASEKLPTYLLAWTTTPWTLPGNVALAVNPKIEYIKAKVGEEIYVVAKERAPAVFREMKYENMGSINGSELVGVEYEPLYSFLKENIKGLEKDKMVNAYKVYPADFVTTVEGTGIVHTAVMYGQDDFELGAKVGLPKFHLVNEEGHFKVELGFLAGRFVKDPATDVEIIKDLAHRGFLFSKEKHEHNYPFCWRCHTPLIYYARDSWYIAMSSLRKKLIKENESINWVPEHIKEGRFGEWLREVKDWAISRERYWGTPLPIWSCDKCHTRKVIGSLTGLEVKPRNQYFVMRHGQSENNVKGLLNSTNNPTYKLTEKGRKGTKISANKLKHKVDLIFVSPSERARETANIVAETIGFPKEKIVVDERLREMTFHELDNGPEDGFAKLYADRRDYFTKNDKGVENRNQIKQRMGAFVEEMEKKHQGKHILIVSHSAPIWMLTAALRGLDIDQTLALKPRGQEYIANSEIKSLDFKILPHNEDYELDLHRPYIDAIKMPCSSCEHGVMTRIKEVLDVWFDSGAVPFAQDPKNVLYPADFISEAIDQTRGWFYTLHAVGILMGMGKAYKNVVCLGHILDKQGKKMSKSIGNVLNPWELMDKYGADALRLWMYTVNQPGDSKNFDEKTVDEIVKKVFNLTSNVLSFYQLYAEKDLTSLPAGKRFKIEDLRRATNVLDQWILARLDQLIETTTNGLDKYDFFDPTRSLRDFIADLSQWYLRRSRDRFKTSGIAAGKGHDKGDEKGGNSDKEAALATTRYVLMTLAKVMAPFTPFFAEYLYKEVGGPLESVHLEDWPEVIKSAKKNEEVIRTMALVRQISSEGLEARMAAKINVRQPLKTLKVNQKSQIKDDQAKFIELIRDELNVKEVIFDTSLQKNVELDTTLTPELREEGMLRELVRAIQDLRKEKGLTVSDKATLKIETNDEGKALVKKFEEKLISATLLDSIKFGEVHGESVKISDFEFKLGL